MTLCPNWSGAVGCSIYDWRPVPCRAFHCVWRKAESLDDWWRPDRCGVIIRDVISDVPPAWAGRPGLTFDVMDHAVIGDDRFILAVADQIAKGVPVMLSVAGARGSGRVFLNDRMEQAVRSRRRDAMLAELQIALADALAVAN